MQFSLKEDKRRKHINKIVEKIATSDVNIKKFWDQLKKIRKKDCIETKQVVNDDGVVINNKDDAKKYIENYYTNLYQIREPTDEFLDFDKKK